MFKKINFVEVAEKKPEFQNTFISPGAAKKIVLGILQSTVNRLRIDLENARTNSLQHPFIVLMLSNKLAEAQKVLQHLQKDEIDIEMVDLKKFVI